MRTHDQQAGFKAIIAVAILLSMLLSTTWAQTLHPKVLTVAMFENEASLWLEQNGLDQTFEIPGSFSPLYCNTSGDHCLVVTGMGIANASATLMALGLSEELDLTNTYVLIAGIAGVPPDIGTLGSAAWAEWVVDGDLAHEIDAREIPETWDYPYFRLGCAEPGCDEGFAAGTEVFHLNPTLTEWAYQLSQGVELATSEDVQAYAQNYFEGSAAQAAPSVLKCDSFSASTYWHGKLLQDSYRRLLSCGVETGTTSSRFSITLLTSAGPSTLPMLSNP